MATSRMAKTMANKEEAASAEENRLAFIEALVEGKTAEEQIVILRNCFNHAITHPWVDDEVADSIIENISGEYGMPYIPTDE